MTLINDDILSAFLDGELDAEGVEMVERELAGNPALARRLDAMRAIESRLGPAFAGMLSERAPERFQAMLSSEPAITSSPRRPLGDIVVSLFRPAVMAPAFAALAAGVFAGVWMSPSAEPGFELAQSGQIAAGGQLADSINVSLSGVPASVGDQELLVRLSFEDSDGRFCRHVSFAAQDMVVCNVDGDWVVEAIAPNATASIQGYQEASGGAPAAIIAAIDRLGATAALDANSERSAIAQNWSSK